MSLTIKPFEQLIAEALTGEIITGGQKGNAAAIVKRANTALAIAQGVAAISAGNAGPGVASIGAALASSQLDAGVALAINGLIAIAGQQVELFATINAALPMLGTVATSVIANVTAGIISAATAELAKYQAPTPATGAGPAQNTQGSAAASVAGAAASKG